MCVELCKQFQITFGFRTEVEKEVEDTQIGYKRHLCFKNLAIGWKGEVAVFFGSKKVAIVFVDSAYGCVIFRILQGILWW